MTFFVAVIEGADEGKTFQVEPGECTIGRSPSNTIVLRDESVAWEHVLLREDDGRLLLQNLSARGARVKGRRVTDDVRISSNEEIELSDRCRIRVQQRLGARGALVTPRAKLIVAAAALLVVIAGVTALALVPDEPPPRRVTAAHWRQAYTRIEDRMERWVERRAVPDEALTVFRNAWRLERALNFEAAAATWEQMRALLLTLPAPGSGDADRRLAEMAGQESKALRVIMGWDLESSSTDFRWNTDEAYADALVWFVRRRAAYCRRQADERR